MSASAAPDNRAKTVGPADESRGALSLDVLDWRYIRRGANQVKIAHAPRDRNSHCLGNYRGLRHRAMAGCTG
jgi:hypothetical protein